MPPATQARILAVDDEPYFEQLIRQRFRKQIREGKFEFVFADNGLTALEKLRQDPAIDMLLTDINMPRMDGLTLLSELKTVRPRMKTIIVSAYGDMKNIRKAMNLGAFDFLTKPIEFADLETTLEKTLEETELIRQGELARVLSEENEKLNELDQLKSKFFTDISHEFRTPLTVISGMADQIEEKPDRWLHRGVEMIRRNTGNLLQLINQILDLRRLESGKLQLKRVQADIIPFIRYLFESFQSLAETRDIQLRLHSEADKLVMDHDPDRLERILSNLLGNAVKFTPTGGTIDLVIERTDKLLRLQVRDSGVGMSAEDLDRIFDRYFTGSRQEGQVDLGTGIGLSLVRELVKLMDGSIRADSRPGAGTTFTVELPVRNEALPPDSASDTVDHTSPPYTPGTRSAATVSELLMTGEPSGELPRLLIVEDNRDVAQYLVSCLEGRYELLLADDGQEGIETALEQVPDLIVSDVMMPRKNGYELCEVLKSDGRTSHIPIVLLTAKADVDSRISGLERGADAYLAKPFHEKELHVRLEKLLELRQKLQEKYNSPEAPIAGQTLEDDFITRVREEIEANIDDEYFGITELCHAIGMSRAQLHRKLKALTGQSTSHYVRSIRLHRAKSILRDTDLNISQVAFEVGFNDPKYFSRVFNEVYGLTPKAFREQ